MLVAGGVAGDAVGVHAAFVGEGALADERLAGAKVHVGHLVDEARQLGQATQAAGQQHFVAAFQSEVGDDADEIDVAAALADAVDGPLHLGRPLGDGGEGVGDRHVAIVVAMDADGDAAMSA